MRHVIVATHLLWPDAHQRLDEIGTVIEWEQKHSVSKFRLMRLLHDADALICNANDHIDSDVIRAGRRLRVIVTMASNVSHIDVEAAYDHDIFVCNTPGVAEEAVADMTMALVLTCARHITLADQAIKNREWQYWEPTLFLGADVQGSTIGIVGLGSIGLLVAHRALGFGMRVLYTDIRRSQDAESKLGLQYGSLDNLLRESDFVTLHASLTESTRGFIDERRLRLMKPGAYLINTAHAQLVKHDALLRALSERWIAGAGLDVFDIEPLPLDDPLLSLGNVILTPHISANSVEGVNAMMCMAAEQVIAVYEGNIPEYAVVIPRDSAA